MNDNAEPEEGKRFYFSSVREFQAGNKKANELGLKAQIHQYEYNSENDDKSFVGVWVKNETTSKRS